MDQRSLLELMTIAEKLKLESPPFLYEQRTSGECG